MAELRLTQNQISHIYFLFVHLTLSISSQLHRSGTGCHIHCLDMLIFKHQTRRLSVSPFVALFLACMPDCCTSNVGCASALGNCRA